MSFTASLDEIVSANRSGLLAKHSSWERVKLTDVARVLNGFPFPSGLFSRDHGIPLLRIRDVLRDRTEALFRGAVDPLFLVHPGELVVGMDGDFNCALWRGPTAALNQRTCKVSPDERFYSRRFLSLVLPGYLSGINDETSSITVKHLSSKTVAQIPLPLPPRHEQDRIVEELDLQLSRLDVAVTAIARVRENLARYRASVLKAACEGRLVPTEAELARAEGRQYEPAGKLLERVSHERETRDERKRAAESSGEFHGLQEEESSALPDGWCWTTVERLNPRDRPCAYGVLQPGDDVPGGVRFVRVGDIEDGKISVQSLKCIDAGVAARYPRTRLRGGEVLITLVGAIGRTAVVPRQLAGANTARAVGVVPLVPGLNAHWVELWFRNPAKVARMTSAAHEVARKTLNLEDVRRASVAIPPLAEQDRIVAEVERRLSIADEIAAAIDTALARAERLRQSILKRAFEGKLVPQDPNDEPASVLLERIRKEREAAEAKQREPKPRRARATRKPRAARS